MSSSLLPLNITPATTSMRPGRGGGGGGGGEKAGDLAGWRGGVPYFRSTGRLGPRSDLTSHSKESPMNKMELIEAVAKARDTSKADAGEIVDLFFSVDGVLAKELKKGGAIAITGFGH